MKKLSFPIKYHCCVCIYMHIYNNKGMEKNKTVERGEKVCRHKRNELVHTVGNTIHIGKELAP